MSPDQTQIKYRDQFKLGTHQVQREGMASVQVQKSVQIRHRSSVKIYSYQSQINCKEKNGLAMQIYEKQKQLVGCLPTWEKIRTSAERVSSPAKDKCTVEVRLTSLVD